MPGDLEGEKRECGPHNTAGESFAVDEYLQRAPGIISRGLVYIIVLLVAAALVYSYSSIIDIIVEAPSVVMPQSDKIKVVADRSGYIERIFIAQGEKLKEGAPLFLIKTKENLSYETRMKSLKKSLPLEQGSFDSQIASLRNELAEAEANYRSALSIGQLKLQQSSIKAVSIDADIQYWSKEVENLREEFENTRALYEKRLTSIDDYNNLKSRLERAMTEVRKLTNEKNLNANADVIVRTEMARESDSLAAKKVLMESKIRSLEIEKRKTLKKIRDDIELNERMLTLKHGTDHPDEKGDQRGNLIRLQRGGVVSELLFRNKGDYVREGDILCTVVPTDLPLMTEISVSNRDIGFIEKGMKIKYKFDAFPYVDYGSLPGRVSFIPPSAIEDRERQFVYRIHGDIEQKYFDIKGKRYHVKPGMTARACIVTKKKSILSMMLGKLKLDK